MVEMGMLKNILTGGAAFLLVFSVLGQVCYSGRYANSDYLLNYYANFPGKYGAYWELSVGITVMGVFALVFFLVYLVFSILGLSVLPDMIVNIIGIVGAVFWFGMFIAECCAISWAGLSSFYSTKKAIADDKMSQYINEHDRSDFEYLYPTVAQGDRMEILRIKTFVKSPDQFDKYETDDEYYDGEWIESPCIYTAENTELCIGSWSVNKMQKYHDKSMKILKDYEKKMEKWEKETMKYQTAKQFSIEKEALMYPVEENIGSTNADDFFYQIVYSLVTSIFFSGQIVGIVLFVGAVALGFIGGGSSPNKAAKEKSEDDKNEEV